MLSHKKCDEKRMKKINTLDNYFYGIKQESAELYESSVDATVHGMDKHLHLRVSIPLSQVSIKSNTLLPTIESLSDFEEEGEVDESFEERDELDKDYQPSGSDSEREIDSCSENQALYKDSVERITAKKKVLSKRRSSEQVTSTTKGLKRKKKGGTASKMRRQPKRQCSHHVTSTSTTYADISSEDEGSYTDSSMGSFIVTDTSDADYYSDSTDCEYEESTGGESSIDEDSEEDGGVADQQEYQIVSSFATTKRASILGKPPRLAELKLLKRGEERVTIITTIAPVWMDLGILMDFDFDGKKLDLIKSSNKGDPEACAIGIFQLWLRIAGKTWEVLLELLKDIEHSELAKRVEKILLKPV